MDLPFHKTIEYELPKIDRNRFIDFINNSIYVQKLLHNHDYQPNIIKRNFSEKLTINPENGNLELLKQVILLDNGTRTLVIAPTGSGKTYSVNSIFKMLRENPTEKQLLVLLCPNKVQNIQNSNSDDYDFEALIEGVKLEENQNNSRQISAVYDKIYDIAKFKKEHPEYKLRIIIDECQTLISASKFRDKTISSIIKLIKDNIADSYTFITATYDSMAGFGFNNIILFEDETYKPVFQSVHLKYSSQKFEDIVMDAAKKETKAYIRLNDKKLIKKLETTLLQDGCKCYSVTSDDKGYRTNPDGSITYTNPIFDHVTNLDDLYNVGNNEADVILASSLLDAGTNFTRYDRISTPVFAVETPVMMNIDEIEQSFNRFRLQKDSDGRPIYLDHAVFVQQTPKIVFSKAIISHLDENANRIQDVFIPSNCIRYTENISPNNLSEIQLSIYTSFLKELVSGQYQIDFYINTDIVYSNSLYINYVVPQHSIDDLESIISSLADNVKGLSFTANTSIATTENIVHTLMDGMNNDYAFIYNDTATEILTAKCPFPIRPHFYTLIGLMEKYHKQAKQQLAIFHQYKIAREVITTNVDIPQVPTKIKEVSLQLPTLEYKDSISNIKTSTIDNITTVTIHAKSNQKIYIVDQNSTLYHINVTDTSLIATIFENRFSGLGAETTYENGNILISSAKNCDDASKTIIPFKRDDISIVTIIDTIHHTKIVIYNNTDNSLGGISQNDYLQSMLTVFQESNPIIGSTLEFDRRMNLRIDYTKLFNSVYTSFQNQYYYHPERLKDELEKRLSIPVTISNYQASEYGMVNVKENREEIMEKIYSLYSDPLQKDTLYSVLYTGSTIPVDSSDETRQLLAEILRSDLYKKEFLELRKMNVLTFDYIIEILNISEKASDTNKHIKRLQYMIINQSIIRGDKMPFASKEMKKQFEEQKALITVINSKRQKTGTKKFTMTDQFMEFLKQDFTIEMQKNNPNFKAPSRAKFKHLVEFVYKIANPNSASRKPELTEPIIQVSDVPKG